jgi:16S rRNA (guanine527-N7)-methyltransferase
MINAQSYLQPEVPKVFGGCQALLTDGLAALGLVLAPSQVGQLWQYADLLYAWAKVVNITAITAPRAIVTHHLLDCLAPLPQVDDILESGCTVLDVGSGAGLPGLVWAIARPHWQFSLVDSVQKKVAFMRQAIANLGLQNAIALHARVEQLNAQPFDAITSRAFSSMAQFVGCSGRLLAQHGTLLALKGKAEVDDKTLPSPWQVIATHRLHVPFLEEERHLFCIQRYNGSLGVA